MNFVIFIFDNDKNVALKTVKFFKFRIKRFKSLIKYSSIRSLE